MHIRALDGIKAMLHAILYRLCSTGLYITQTLLGFLHHHKPLKCFVVRTDSMHLKQKFNAHLLIITYRKRHHNVSICSFNNIIVCNSCIAICFSCCRHTVVLDAMSRPEVYGGDHFNDKGLEDSSIPT